MTRFHAEPDGPVLLDTHIWIWYVSGNARRLPKKLRASLDARAARGALHVSDISHWEVSMKTASGALDLSIDPGIWLNRASRAPGIRMIAVDRDILFMSTRLEQPVHGDPADRILLATALLHDLPIVTADRLMVNYSEMNRAVAVIDASRAGP